MKIGKVIYNMPIKPYKCIFCFITSDILPDTPGAGGRQKRNWTFLCSSSLKHRQCWKAHLLWCTLIFTTRMD